MSIGKAREKTREDAAREHARHVVHGDENTQRRQRIKETQELMKNPLPRDDPEETLREAMKRFDSICGLIQEIGEQFLRGGSREVNARRLWCWNQIAGRVRSSVQLSLRRIQRLQKAEEKFQLELENGKTKKEEEYRTSWILVDLFINSFLIPDVISRANTLLGLCWTEEDVNINQVFEFIVPVSTQGFRGESLDRKDEPSQEY